MTDARQDRAVPPEDSRLHAVWAVLRRQRWLVAAVAAAAVAATLLFLLVVSPTYRASASLRIEEQRPQAGMLQALEALSGGAEVETELQVLRSRTLLEQVTDSLDLHVTLASPGPLLRRELLERLDAGRDASAATYRLERTGDGAYRVEAEFVRPPVPGDVFAFEETERRELGTLRVGEPARLDGLRFTLSDSAAAYEELRIEVLPFQEAVEEHQRALSVGRPDRQASVLVATFEGPDPEVVRDVPNLLVREFIERRREVQSAEARNTVRFLSDQLDTLEIQLSDAEDRLQGFQERTRVVAPEFQAESNVRQLAELKARRDLLATERQALGDLLAQVEAGEGGDPAEPSAYRRLMAFPTLLGSSATAEILRALAELDTRRSELLSRFTEEDPDVGALTDRIRELERQLHEIAVTYRQGLDDQIANLESQLAGYEDQLDRLPEAQVQLARLRRETEVLGSIYEELQTRRKEAEVAAAVEDPSAHVVDAAVRPREPVSPRPWLSLALALLLGGGLGAGVAFLRERMDTALHTADDLEAAAGVPVLAVVPTMPDLLTELDPMDPVAEAFRSLRTNLSFVGEDRGVPGLLAVTSPLPGDGKSTVATNLALTLARREEAGEVLLVDADLRRGELAGLLDVPERPGLADVLGGEADLESAIRPAGGGVEGGVYVLPGGTRPPNPTELLDTDRMRELLVRLRARFANVLVDVPPLNLVVDAAVVGARCDGALLVARAGVSESAAVAFAMSQMEKADVRVLGAVLNDADVERQSRYGRYGEGYGYYGQGG